MKNRFKLIMLLFFSTAVLSNCKKEIKEIGAVQSKIEGIKGKWEITKIIMVDTLATVPEPIEITDYFQSFSKMPGIVFDISSNTYTSDVSGIAYDFFGSAGSWAFDDPQYPKTLTLTTSGKAPVVFGLLASIRPIDTKLKIQKYKYCDSAMTDFKYAYQLQLERR